MGSKNFISNKITILLSLLSILFVTLFSVSFADETSSTEIYTRAEMQDMIKATALSYYYNKEYSDYDQKNMDADSSINWRTFMAKPEAINRSNYYHIDCSSFVASVYMHSLGYNFIDFYELSTSTYRKFNTSSGAFVKYYAKSYKF